MVRWVPEGGLGSKEDGWWGRKENGRGLSRAEPYTGVEGLRRPRSKDAS